MNVIETDGLGKQYRRRWALTECSIGVPAGAVVALVGPNGAGKTTLLHLAAGLVRPDAGTVRVLDRDPARDREVLPRIGLLAQDAPLYRSFTVADMLRFGRHLNTRWDDALVEHRLGRLGIDPRQKVGTLSGGQRAQVALLVALGKRPELLLLDEPLASLDPLARRDLLGTLMETAAEGNLTVVLSSHLITDLERVCDHLIVVVNSTVRLAGEIDEVLATHRVVAGPRPTSPIPGVAAVIDATAAGDSASMIVRTNGPLLDPRWAVTPTSVEDVVLAYLSSRQLDGSRSTPALVDVTKAAS